MLAFHFGPPDRRLFGTFHPPQAGGAAAARSAVLLCNPFGQEAVRVHRLYRVIAQRLARQGTGVLRFDFFGTGDSAGDDREGDLQGWIQDTQVASRELEQRVRPTRLVWLGARLGASVAALSAARAPRPPDELVLWEPVIDGLAYLRELAESTLHAWHTSFVLHDPAWAQRLASLPALEGGDANGFEAGPALQEQLRKLGAASFKPPRVRQIHVAADAGSPGLEAALGEWRAHPLPVTLVPKPSEFDWSTEEALNSALVPHDAVQRLVDWAEGVKKA